jgi:hypothetical protein
VTPEKLAKIKALAEDVRGDPATRMIAKDILRRYNREPPPSFHDVEDVPQNPPGMRNSNEYEQYRFMSLHNWGRSKISNNLVHNFTHKGRAYRVILFAHRKTPTYGWLRIDVARNNETWSSKFSSMPAAHADAWASLMKI